MSFDSERFLRIAASSPVLARNIVQVGVLEGDHVRYLGEHVGRDPFASTARPGDVRGVASTALGIAILTGLPPVDADAVIQRLPVGGRERARAAVALARRRGYAIDPGQVHPSVFGVAIPVMGHPGVAVGVPLVEVLQERWQEGARRYQEVVNALRAAARVLQPTPAA